MSTRDSSICPTRSRVKVLQAKFFLCFCFGAAPRRDEMESFRLACAWRHLAMEIKASCAIFFHSALFFFGESRLYVVLALYNRVMCPRRSWNRGVLQSCSKSEYMVESMDTLPSSEQCFGSTSVLCGSASGSYLKTKCGSGFGSGFMPWQNRIGICKGTCIKI